MYIIYKIDMHKHDIVDTWITDMLPIDHPEGFYLLWGNINTTAMFELTDDQHDVSMMYR